MMATGECEVQSGLEHHSGFLLFYMNALVVNKPFSSSCRPLVFSCVAQYGVNAAPGGNWVVAGG